jgi:glycosyltransferase involved in cell wall biosynthesis
MALKIVKKVIRKRVRQSRPTPVRVLPTPRMIPPLPSLGVLLSILVPTVPGRERKLAELLARLDPQVARADVELLVLRDNRGMTIGEKRNKLISIARGEYVVFCDDDDMVEKDYVTSIAGALVASRPDVVNFVVRVEGHGPAKPCRYGLALKHENLPTEYHRKPNHLMVWRRALASKVPFPLQRQGEDTAWAEKVVKFASTETVIDRVLYRYRFRPQ